MYEPMSQMFLGKIFFSDSTNRSAFWKDRRKVSAHAFSSQHMKHMTRCCREETERWIEETLKPSIEVGTAIQLPEEMNRITIRVVCSSGFDYNISEDESERYVQEVHYAIVEYFMKQPSNPIRKYKFWDTDVRRAKEASKFLQNMSLRIIQNFRKNRDAPQESLLGTIVNNPCYKDDYERAGEVSAFLFAGHDTTGFSLAWILLLLAKHPAEMQKLRDQLRHVNRQMIGVNVLNS